MNEKPKNHWRKTKRFFLGLAYLAGLIGLFYAEEDWRGWYAWHRFQHHWEAKGERFDPASVIPPMVPEEQNFALTPIVFTSYGNMLTREGKEIPPKDRETNFVNRLKMAVAANGKSPSNGIGNRQKSTMTDLKVWQQYYRAQAETADAFPVALQPQSAAADVLLALSKYDSAIKEVRQARHLPDSRFPLEYDKEDPWAILLPHLAALKGCSQVLQLRAIAELQNGQSEQALDDVMLTLRLTDSIRTEPFLISHLVRIAILQIALQPVWEGLARHQWSDVQLIELERELAALDFLPDYKLAMHSELVFQGSMFDYLRRHPEQFPNMFSDGNSVKTPLLARIIWRLIPSGWIYQNQLRCARPMVELYLPVADVSQGIISPAAAHRGDARVEVDTKHRNPYNLAEKLFLPALGNAARKFASGQSSADLARVAMALERYRLAHGTCPESLDALAPQFIAKLPHDVINGQPLHYRPEAGGQFVLYSVGWNEKDDDGEVGLGKNGAVDINTGDWVW
jgi:tetratricopeptide (TPR) repeat protein